MTETYRCSIKMNTHHEIPS